MNNSGGRQREGKTEGGTVDLWLCLAHCESSLSVCTKGGREGGLTVAEQNSVLNTPGQTGSTKAGPGRL